MTKNDLAHTDAVVIGSGPNGLAGAISLAGAGLSTLVVEAQSLIGGSTRSMELTLPGFTHDICSAVHPLGISSPFFRKLELEQNGLKWIQPPVPLAHPLDDGSAVLLRRSVDDTCDSLDPSDRKAYRKLMTPLIEVWDGLVEDIMRPVAFPRHPFTMAKFAWRAVRDAKSLAESCFGGKRGKALFAGLAAHSVLPLDERPSGAFGLILGISAHAAGWPIAEGGSGKIAAALLKKFTALEGQVIQGRRVESIDEFQDAKAILCDLTPRQLYKVAGHRLPYAYQRKIQNYQYGPGVYKVDWALSGPIPWKAKECSLAATVHLGGTLEEIAVSERAAWEAHPAEFPFVLLVQPTLFDNTRAPAGKHTAWAYCHVPNGSNFSMLERIENQVERFAPGFRSLILARSAMLPRDMESHNSNLVGGDITGGAQSLKQLILRPTLRLYSTPCRGLYLCSSSTPPGAGVHGMCGYFAARRALVDLGLSPKY